MLRVARLIGGLLVLALVALATARPQPASAGRTFRAAFVYVGPVSDLGWSYAHDQGRLAAARTLGIETAYTENVPGPDAERVLRGYAEQGYNVIFATSFDFADAVLNVAKDYPNVIFEQATGLVTAPNVGTYNGRIYQAWYLAGMVAGRMTKSNTIGYVAPYPIPEVIRHINAFTLGVRAVNPNAAVQPQWIFTWFDRPVEGAAVETLARDGADVIARESDSDQPEIVAERLGLYAIGYNAVAPGPAPHAFLTAPIFHWDVYYVAALRAMMEGTWPIAADWWGMDKGLVDLAPLSPLVPDDVRSMVAAERQRIAGGRFDVFTGPIRDTDGLLRVPPGDTMTDAELLDFDWLVQGVAGGLPR